MIKIKFSDEEINYLKDNYINFYKLKTQYNVWEIETIQLEDIKSWAIFNRAISKNEEDRIILKSILDKSKEKLEEYGRKLQKKWGLIFSSILPIFSIIGFFSKFGKDIAIFLWALQIGFIVNLFLIVFFALIFLLTRRGKTFYLSFISGTALLSIPICINFLCSLFFLIR